MPDFPRTRDLAYEENNARVVWNSQLQSYVARPCHGVADPGMWQRMQQRDRIMQWMVRLLGVAFLGAIFWRIVR